MMKEEFEALAGYEVTWEDYCNIIEPMYMATKLNKAEFVKCIDKKRFALRPLKSIVKEMKKLAAQLEETCTHFSDYETKEKIEDLAREYVKRKYGMGFSFGVHEEMKWSCYYPKSIEIWGVKDYITIESIVLV